MSNIKIIIHIVYFFMVLTATTSETYMITRSKTGAIEKTDLTKPHHEDWNSKSIDALKIIKRIQWLSVEPQTWPDELELPVRHVMVLSTGTEICTTEMECSYRVRLMQSFDLENLIPYNFLIGGDGNVYEGRGWNYKGAHPKNDYKGDDTISIVYLGTVRKEPTKKQVQATQMLLGKSVREGKLAPDYVVHAVFDMNASSILPEAVTLICSNDNNIQSGCSQLNGGANVI